MKNTEKLKLKKLEKNEYYNVDDFNENADILDTEVDDRLSKSKGGDVSAGVTFKEEITFEKTTHTRTLKPSSTKNTSNVGTSTAPYTAGYFKELYADSLGGNCLDDTVSEGSNKPVTSGGVYEALNTVEKDITDLQDRCDGYGGDITQLQDRCDGFDGEITKLDGSMDAANNNITALYTELGQVRETAEGNKADIDVLKGNGDGSVEKTVTDKIAAVVANAPEDLDTLKEIASWIEGHEGSAAEMSEGIKANAAAIDEMPKKFLEKTTSYYDKNTVDGNVVENVGKPVYFGNKVIHNNDLFTHKILPEQPDKQYTIGMANIPYYSGYFKNMFADSLFKIDGTPYSFDKDINLSSTDVKGILPLSKGGTGASTMTQARINLGLKDAATKSYTTSVASGNQNLPTSDAVYKEIQRVKDELESDDTIIKESISNNSDDITLLRSDYESQIETLYDIINGLQERIEALEDKPSEPATVTYYVRHYRQDADTGNYTLYTTDTKTGNNGALVSAAFNSYSNYKSNEGKSKRQGTLSSDSTLYLDLYYDLVTYTVAYDLDSGTGASGVSYASESVRHGAKITVKAAPTKTNFIFKHWSSGSATYTPGQQVTITSAMTFKAMWEADTSDTRDYSHVFDYSDNDGLVHGQQSSFNAEHTSTSFQVKTGDKIDLSLTYGLHCDSVQANLEYELYGDASLSCLGESINLGLNYSHEPNGGGSGRTSGNNTKTFTVTDTDNGKYLDVAVHADQPMGSSGGSVLHGAINTLIAEVKVNGNKVYSISA